ncbi:hypothetical protein [Methylobacterium sp. Leaf106]|uniref:hypothetical protein n=1 Tax=Methylobacterium sp. Leaf106 TaxID=1736255 RepID=UPI000B17640B|nr:hypothetical protein [Methylobacterium sp. Leaf106]
MKKMMDKNVSDIGIDSSLPDIGLGSSALINDPNQLRHESNMALVSGRGRIGKTGLLRGVASLALLAGRSIRLCDFDRSNASMSKYYPESKVLQTASQLPMEKKIEEVMMDFLEGNQGYGLDIGGNDKTFEKFLSEGDISKLLDRHDKYITWLQVFSTDEEDVSYFRTAYDALSSHQRIRWVICLSYASAPDGDEVGRFAPIREHPFINQVLDAGGEMFGIPKLAIHAEVVRLRLRYEDAIANKPGSEGLRIGEWSATRVEAWLDRLRTSVEPFKGWLP